VTGLPDAFELPAGSDLGGGEGGFAGLDQPVAWRVCIPTADQTCVRLRCGDAAERVPWPLSRALVELVRFGLRPSGRFRSLGAGRGRPLIHSQQAEWCGLPVHLESLVTQGGRVVEAALEAPPMDRVMQHAEERAWWGLVDVFARAVDGVHGALTDGEAVVMEPAPDAAEWCRRLRRHVGILVPDRLASSLAPAGAAYRYLPTSGLTVVLR
jgi:hypothetical protein